MADSVHVELHRNPQFDQHARHFATNDDRTRSRRCSTYFASVPSDFMKEEELQKTIAKRWVFLRGRRDFSNFCMFPLEFRHSKIKSGKWWRKAIGWYFSESIFQRLAIFKLSLMTLYIMQKRVIDDCGCYQCFLYWNKGPYFFPPFGVICLENTQTVRWLF